NPIHVGNDVWLGANSVIFPNINVGNGSVVGAGAVVKHDVPEYAIVAGVPARILKYRFDTETIRKLKQIEWWRISPSTFFENSKIFNSPPTNENIKKLEQLVEKSLS